MRPKVQLPLPPMVVKAVDRDRVARSSDVDRWLARMNAAIDASAWKQDALAAFMGLDKAYLSRLRSGEKPWRIDHVVALPEDIARIYAQTSAEAFGFIVVVPVSGDEAVRLLVGGLIGVLRDRRVA